MQNIDYDLRSVQEVRDLARLGQIATEKIANYTEDQIDKIIRNMVRVAEENAVSLAQMAVEETGFGKVADKTYKNHMASTLLYDAIKDMKTIGIVSEDPIARTMDVADPVGLLMGIVPSTNPTSTAIYHRDQGQKRYRIFTASIRCKVYAEGSYSDARCCSGSWSTGKYHRMHFHAFHACYR